MNDGARPRTATRTRKSAIAEYWLDTHEGYARLPGNSALIDVGEPSCFACGWMATDPDLEPVLWDVWNKAMLQRCHLVPRALGGADTPSNLVLLCARCHREAPDVGHGEYMLRWIGAHESWGALFIRELQAAMTRHDVAEHEVVAFNELDVTTMVDLNRTLLGSWAVPVGGAFSYATLAACAIEAVRRATTNAHGDTSRPLDALHSWKDRRSKRVADLADRPALARVVELVGQQDRQAP